MLESAKIYDANDVSHCYYLKNVHLKMQISVIYVLIYSGCLEEYIGGTGVGKTRLRDSVRVYRKHIKQPVHQKLKVEEHIRICGRGSSKIFSFLQM